MPLAFRPDPDCGFTDVIGIGGIGSGIAFQLEGDHTLGREESRLGTLLSSRDYCKLHIVEHYIATMMGCSAPQAAFRAAAIGVIGNDAVGGQLLTEMHNAGIDTRWVRQDPEHPTLFSTCYIYPDRTGGNITSNNSAAAYLNEADLEQAANHMCRAGKRGIALCLPEVPLAIRREFLSLATRCGNFRAASFTLAEIAPAKSLDLFSSIDLLALNQEEASALTGFEGDGSNIQAFLDTCAASLTALQPEIQLVISAGGRGAYGFRHGRWDFCPAPQVDVASTAGGGDALLGGVLSGMAAGVPLIGSEAWRQSISGSEIHCALEIGVLLASLSVTSPDAIHFGATLEALKNFAASEGIAFSPQIQQACIGL